MATKTTARRLKPKAGATKAKALERSEAESEVRRDLWRSAELELKQTKADLEKSRFSSRAMMETLKSEVSANATLRESLGDVLWILTEVGGFMRPEHQALALRARRRFAGGQ